MLPFVGPTNEIIATTPSKVPANGTTNEPAAMSVLVNGPFAYAPPFQLLPLELSSSAQVEGVPVMLKPWPKKRTAESPTAVPVGHGIVILETLVPVTILVPRIVTVGNLVVPHTEKTSGGSLCPGKA